VSCFVGSARTKMGVRKKPAETAGDWPKGRGGHGLKKNQEKKRKEKNGKPHWGLCKTDTSGGGGKDLANERDLSLQKQGWSKRRTLRQTMYKRRKKDKKPGRQMQKPIKRTPQKKSHERPESGKKKKERRGVKLAETG